MDKSYNDIMTQAGRIVTIYPKQLKARYRDAQWVFHYNGAVVPFIIAAYGPAG